MSKPIRVAVIDDHSKIHLAIAAVIDVCEDMELVGHGSNGHEALQICAEFQPDILLMDVIMPGMNGIEASVEIHKQYPQVKILALSSFQDEEGVRAMIQAGAVGYILKTSSVDDLTHTIRTAYGGNSVFSPEITQTLLRSSQKESIHDFGLTPREREILKLLVDGLNNAEIAAALTISLSTAKFHVSSIFSKLGVTNRVEATTVALEHKLVE